ncbi:MAG: hypothetical protein KF755_13920 [Burkholderiaceae bacterium]|nr:hypothetical protein [Burkholderiaceae bacterium]
MHTPRPSPPEGLQLPTNRSFGLVFCGFFALLALFPLLSGGSVRLWSAVASAAFGATALFFPSVLTPLNRLWMRFGALLHRIVSPIVLALLFFVVITPFGLVMRLLGKDPLKLRSEPVQTYWIDREPPGPQPESLNNQF